MLTSGLQNIPPPLNPDYIPTEDVADDLRQHPVATAPPALHIPNQSSRRSPVHRETEIGSSNATPCEFAASRSSSDDYHHDVLSFVYQTFESNNFEFNGSNDGNRIDMEVESRNIGGPPSRTDSTDAAATAVNNSSTSSTPRTQQQTETDAMIAAARSFDPSMIETVVIDDGVNDHDHDHDDNDNDDNCKSSNTPRSQQPKRFGSWNNSSDREETLKESNEIATKLKKITWGTKRFATSTVKKACNAANINKEGMKQMKETTQKTLDRSMKAVASATVKVKEQTQQTVVPSVCHAASMASSKLAAKFAKIY